MAFLCYYIKQGDIMDINDDAYINQLHWKLKTNLFSCNYENSIDVLAKIVELDPNNCLVYFNILIDNSYYEEVLPLLEKIDANSIENFIQYRYLVGKIKDNLNFDKYSNKDKKSLTVDLDKDFNGYQLIKDSIKYYLNKLKKFNYTPIYYLIAKNYQRVFKYEKSYEYADKYYQLDGSNYYLDNMLLLAFLSYENNNESEALEYLRNGLEVYKLQANSERLLNTNCQTWKEEYNNLKELYDKDSNHESFINNYLTSSTKIKWQMLNFLIGKKKYVVIKDIIDKDFNSSKPDYLKHYSKKIDGQAQNIISFSSHYNAFETNLMAENYQQARNNLDAYESELKESNIEYNLNAMYLLLTMLEDYQNNNFDREYCHQNQEIIETVIPKKIEILRLFNFGISLVSKNKFNDGLKKLYLSLQFCNKENSSIIERYIKCIDRLNNLYFIGNCNKKLSDNPIENLNRCNQLINAKNFDLADNLMNSIEVEKLNDQHRLIFNYLTKKSIEGKQWNSLSKESRNLVNDNKKFGDYYYDQQNYNDALKYYQQGLSTTNSYLFHYLLGITYLKLNDDENALLRLTEYRNSIEGGHYYIINNIQLASIYSNYKVLNKSMKDSDQIALTYLNEAKIINDFEHKKYTIEPLIDKLVKPRNRRHVEQLPDISVSEFVGATNYKDLIEDAFNNRGFSGLYNLFKETNDVDLRVHIVKRLYQEGQERDGDAYLKRVNSSSCLSKEQKASIQEIRKCKKLYLAQSKHRK